MTITNFFCGWVASRPNVQDFSGGLLSCGSRINEACPPPKMLQFENLKTVTSEILYATIRPLKPEKDACYYNAVPVRSRFAFISAIIFKIRFKFLLFQIQRGGGADHPIHTTLLLLKPAFRRLWRLASRVLAIFSVHIFLLRIGVA